MSVSCNCFVSTIRQLEKNLTEFLDEVYEHQARKFPGGHWDPDNPRYVDSVRKPHTICLLLCNYGLCGLNFSHFRKISITFIQVNNQFGSISMRKKPFPHSYCSIVTRCDVFQSAEI